MKTLQAGAPPPSVNAPTYLGVLAVHRPTSWRWRRAALSLRHDPSAIFGGIVLGLVLLAAMFAPLLAPHNPDLVNPLRRLLPPLWSKSHGSMAYILGTDAVGRDILSRLMYGARISLSVSVISVTLSCLFGVTLGIVAGFYGGSFDAFIMRIADVQLAFPLILFAITVTAIFGAGLRNLVLVLVVANWVVFTRVVRGEVLVQRQLPYVEAARLNGCSNGRIMRVHILPNVFSVVLVVFTLLVGDVLILESALSFLGLGVEPTIPTWGSMLNEGRSYFMTAWWIETWPGLAIMFTALAINLLGDWFRDVLDLKVKIY